MKQKKSDVFEELGEYLGSDVAEAARELSKKKDYSEFKLAEALGREVNETRNLLYKMHNSSLATFIKKKDHKIGWYIYYWTFQDNVVPDFLLAEKRGRLDSINAKVSREEKSDHFSCQSKCVSTDFDKAFEFSFHCPECGSLLEQENNAGKVEDWGKEAATLEKDMEALRGVKAKEKQRKEKENNDNEKKGSAPSPK